MWFGFGLGLKLNREMKNLNSIVQTKVGVYHFATINSQEDIQYLLKVHVTFLRSHIKILFRISTLLNRRIGTRL